MVSIGATTASIQTVTASLQTASSSMAATAALTATGLDVFDSGSNRVARFSDSVTLGKTGNHSRTVISNEAFDMFAFDSDEGDVVKKFTLARNSSGNPVIAMGGALDADVSVTSTDNVVRIDPKSDQGLFIFRNSNHFVKLSNSTLDIHAGSSSNTEASFGSTTTIGRTAGEHIKITSSALEVKTDANTTVLSASAAGLEMKGTIRASAGEISTFSITSGSIDSNTNNVKRGIKLEPGTSIRGYGTTVHTTETVQGKFSFGVGTIAPAADSPAPFSGDIMAAAGGKFDASN